MTEFTCEKCLREFSGEKYLSQHRRYCHQTTRLFICDHCNFSTKYKCSLKGHITKRHIENQLRSRQPIEYNCVLCKAFTCGNRSSMITHYKAKHDLDTTGENIAFDTNEQFLTWKEKIEEAGVCRFICPNGSKTRQDYMVQYYRCFRDGSFHSHAKGKRRLKVTGSVKIGGVCPASMKVESNKVTGIVRVNFISQHVGHSVELWRMNLTKRERAEIARQLASNIPYKTILNQLRPAEKEATQRIHLTTRQDIWNIRASYKLQNADRGFLDANDRTSVQKESETVQFSKPQGKNSPSYPQLRDEDKHIHYVASSLIKNEETPSALQNKHLDDDHFGELNDDTSMEEIIVQESPNMGASPVSGINLESQKDKLREKVEEILENVECDDHAQILWNALLPVIPAFKAHPSTTNSRFVPSSDQATRINPLEVSPQKDLFSTKSEGKITSNAQAKSTRLENILTSDSFL